MKQINNLGQPVGERVEDWTKRPRPERAVVAGQWCRLEPLSQAAHAATLAAAFQADTEGRDWTYLPYGPFDETEKFQRWVDWAAGSIDPLFLAVIPVTTGKAEGVLALMRIEPAHGVFEIGHIHFAPSMQRTQASTEAIALLLRYMFDELGYRRCEWKCDSFNAPSRRTALRLGLRYEGTFRQAMIVKGRNRDTAWFALLDAEWKLVGPALERWLAPANFDADGRQRLALSSLTAAAVGPASQREGP